jgi:hypothetical protein
LVIISCITSASVVSASGAISASGPLKIKRSDLASDIGGSLSFEEGLEGSRSPLIGSDLVMGAGEGLDASAHESGERFDRMARVFALADYAPDQAENVSNAVIELSRSGAPGAAVRAVVPRR